MKLKADGNKNFTSKPPKLEAARDSYLCALDCLPAVPKHLPPPSLDEDRFVEITDEQAEQIERDWEAGPERVAVDNDIRDAEKALWGNLGAVYGQQVSCGSARGVRGWPNWAPLMIILFDQRESRPSWCGTSGRC